MNVTVNIDIDKVFKYMESQMPWASTYVWNSGPDDDPCYGVDGILDDVLEAVQQTATYEVN